MVPLIVGLIVALLASAVLALVERSDAPSRKKYFYKMFGWCFLGMVVAAWLMHFLPR
jgi:hypothetical protein